MTQQQRKIRILVAKPGLDGHDRGAKVVARALSDAGYEVVYTGLHQTPEMIAAAAVQEAVDAVGLSIMSGAHMTLFPAIEALRKRGAGEVLVFGGGIIPDDDLPSLQAAGVAQIFKPGASTREIIDWVERTLLAAPGERLNDVVRTLLAVCALVALGGASARADEDEKVGRQLQEVLRAHRAEVAACVADKPASGEALIRFFVTSDGAVGRVEVLKDETNQPATALCVVEKIRGWRVPTLAGDDTRQFVFPLVFKPEAPTPASSVRVVVPLSEGKPGPIPNSLLDPRVLLDERTVGKTQASLTRLVLRPTARQQMHKHPGAIEVFYVVKGIGRVRSGGPMVESAEAGDVVFIPAGAAHNMEAAPLAPLELLQLFIPGGPERAYNDRTARDGTVTVPKGYRLPPGPRPPSLVRKAAAQKTLPILGGKASVTLLLDGVDPSVSIQRLEADAGAAVPTHQHDLSDELIYIVSGRGEMTVAGQSYTVKAGDAIHIPLATPHSLHVTEKLLAVQCYAPAGPEQRFKPKSQGAR